MTSKGLSSDEISALLGQQLAEEKDVSLPSFSQFEKEVLIEILSVSFGSASTALNKLLAKQVSISGPELSIVQRDALVNDMALPSFVVLGNYTGKWNSIQFLFIPKEHIEKIVQMMQLNVDNDEGEVLYQVVQQVADEMTTAASSSMSAVVEAAISHSLTGMDFIENSAAEFSIGNFTEEEWFVHASFQLQVGGQEPEPFDFTICIPVRAAKQLAGVITNPIDDTNTEGEIPSMSSNNSNSHSTNSAGGATKIQPVQFSSFDESPSHHSEPNNIDLLLDIPLQVTVELGRTKRMVKEILEVSPGSIIELDKLAGEPVDILVNNKLIAVGEVVVIDDNFGVRVTDILSPMDRISKLR
jgi:flagellar motor switch protein FliN